MTDFLLATRSIAYAIYKQLNGRKRQLSLRTDSLREASRLVIGTYTGQFEYPFSGVRGPPGTGKTALAEAALTSKRVEDELVDKIFLYEAPTNELVTSAFMRLMTLTVDDCQSAKEFLRSVRLYGSMVPRPYIAGEAQQLKNLCPDITENDLRAVTEGAITEDVKYVFATEFQRASARAKIPPKFLAFIDEASTSPFYLPYTPFSDAALKEMAQGKWRGLIEGLVVVGDERQAIGVGPDYQGWGERLLVLPMIKQMLETLDAQNQFYHLRETLRLPAPTEDPLDEGFYSDLGGLQAVEDFRDRYKQLRLHEWQEKWERCAKLAELTYIVSKKVETALSSQLPVIVLNTKQSYGSGERIEPRRVSLSIKLAALFKCLYPQLEVAVTGPYRDLVSTAKLNYIRKFRQLGTVQFLSVQSILGKEADVVISVLGKEYTGSDDMQTIYFMEPNNLNVQLSRHRGMLIIIGDLIRLRNSAAKEAKRRGLTGARGTPATMIRKTCDTILVLSGINRPRKNIPRSTSGSGGVFVKLE
jgi:hypothetical protein